uniref:Erythromycin biosynthesis protein CIII-like C-terminal domain-containing protein n=1 Tax=Kalanchoe fedtschenkoi TaxID=63787 RepID=A0A7N0RFV6_KALFE
MEMESRRRKRIAVFMAFGTKGDVHPVAALCGAFACDQRECNVFLVTHSAHEDLSSHLAALNVTYVPISSPPVLAVSGDEENQDEIDSFARKKKMIAKEHRQECVTVMEKIYGDGLSLKGDFVVINFFALEGWSLAELYGVPCVVAAPYVVPYSAPSSFERRFIEELPLLYKYLQQAPAGKVSWRDVLHWMWPLFTDDWGTWRSEDLRLSALPFTDPVTDVPSWHDRFPSPLLLYGFSEEVVECPGYWPSSIHVCGFWFPPAQWQFSCSKCRESYLSASLGHPRVAQELCSGHVDLLHFLASKEFPPPIFVGLSSIGSMGFMKNPQAFLRVLQSVSRGRSHRFVLFSGGYEPLNTAVQEIAAQTSTSKQDGSDRVSLFEDHLFYFSGSVPYDWLFPKCLAAIHHGGSGSTSAALRAGLPQVICPFMLDQFYWAQRMSWLGVAPEPLKRSQLLPDTNDASSIAEAAQALSEAIAHALIYEVKARASEIAARISHENGIGKAVKILNERVIQ